MKRKQLIALAFTLNTFAQDDVSTFNVNAKSALVWDEDLLRTPRLLSSGTH